MAVRKPFVDVGGKPEELPVGDVLPPGLSGVSIGDAIGNSPIDGAVLYISGGNRANSDRFKFDGTDVFLRNTTDATVSSQQPKAPFLYFRTSRWNITNAVADDKQFRIGFQGTPTEYDHVTASKFSVEHYRDSVWYSLLELTNASSFLDTVLKIKSPVSPNVGGQIIFNASGAIKFQNLSGVASTLVASKFGANETFTVFANDPSVPYSPEIRSYFGSPIRFRDGQPGWFGAYAEGTHGGNSFVTIENPYGLRVGVYGTPSAMIEAESSTRDLFKLMYNGSNYMLATVSSSGVTTLDAVGSGAKFVFADDVEIADAKNIVLNTTTGTKIGTSTTQKIGFFNKTPVVQPTALTTQLTQITYPGVTYDFSIGNVTLGGYGFVNQNEGDTFIAVVENLQQRMSELETKLKALGLLA